MSFLESKRPFPEAESSITITWPARHREKRRLDCSGLLGIDTSWSDVVLDKWAHNVIRSEAWSQRSLPKRQQSISEMVARSVVTRPIGPGRTAPDRGPARLGSVHQLPDRPTKPDDKFIVFVLVNNNGLPTEPAHSILLNRATFLIVDAIVVVFRIKILKFIGDHCWT